MLRLLVASAQYIRNVTHAVGAFAHPISKSNSATFAIRLFSKDELIVCYRFVDSKVFLYTFARSILNVKGIPFVQKYFRNYLTSRIHRLN